jgi:hypothetical protein
MALLVLVVLKNPLSKFSRIDCFHAKQFLE